MEANRHQSPFLAQRDGDFVRKSNSDISIFALLCFRWRKRQERRQNPQWGSGGGLPATVGEPEALPLRQVRSAAGGTLPSRSDSQRRSALRAIRQVGRSEKDLPSPPALSLRRSESAGSESAKLRSASLDKEDRFYPTRGLVAAVVDENGGGGGSGGGEDRVRPVAAVARLLPRFFISLSNKEKEEDFLAMKGGKLPQRPKKRPKILQKRLLLVSPGA